ncbi:MAG: hypothetical protein CSA34_01825 [Desulfobulbus propionicus]|nr:MAG: hypothetical protein CSA34_01825 [Desulfobulbus propionicus]
MTASLPAFLTRHWKIKVLSLFMGFCLWFVVVEEDQVDMTMTVPLEIHNLPPHLVISNQFKKDIEVSVRGPRKTLQDIKQRGITRPVDLGKAVAGTSVISNNQESISFPKGVEVLHLQPANITLFLDELIRKDFPIEPLTEGTLAPGFSLEEVAVEPPVLTVSGPKTLLEKERTLTTFFIDINGWNSSATVQAYLNLAPSLQELIGETVVMVQVKVSETILTKTVRGIPINVRDNPVPAGTEPTSVTVVASIPENLIRDTPELAMLFRASVNGNTVKDDPQKVEVSVNGIDVPGHVPIQINSILPQQVFLFPEKLNSSPTKKIPGKTRAAQNSTEKKPGSNDT